MSVMLQKKSLECGGIRFTPEMIEVIEDGRVSRRLPRISVKRIDLGYGFQAARPKIQACVGVLLMIVGLLPAWDLAYRFEHGGTIRPYYYAMLMAFTVFGAWLLRDSVRRGYFLLVTTESSWEKLPFRSIAEPDKVDRFLQEANTELGYFVFGRFAATA